MGVGDGECAFLLTFVAEDVCYGDPDIGSFVGWCARFVAGEEFASVVCENRPNWTEFQEVLQGGRGFGDGDGDGFVIVV